MEEFVDGDGAGGGVEIKLGGRRGSFLQRCFLFDSVVFIFVLEFVMVETYGYRQELIAIANSLWLNGEM